jgi:hypothetical protein
LLYYQIVEIDRRTAGTECGLESVEGAGRLRGPPGLRLN